MHPKLLKDVDVDVILINKKLPDMEFTALLKANKKRLHYIMGTVFNSDDLEKTCINEVSQRFKKPDVHKELRLPPVSSSVTSLPLRTRRMPPTS